MDIGFFINFENEVIQLPVNPEKVEVSYDSNNKTMEVIQLGQINLLRDRKLAKIKFNSFFPFDTWFPAIRITGDFKGPDFYKEFILKIVESKKPCRLVITGIEFTSMVSIEKFKFHHQGGDHEDAYYDIEFKEYREFGIAQIQTIAPKKKVKNLFDTVPNKSNKSQVPPPAKTITPVEITKGCNVTLNGRVHYDSYGSKPGKSFTNYKAKVNLVNKKGSHPYHVTTLTGEWLGWVGKESVVLS